MKKYLLLVLFLIGLIPLALMFLYFAWLVIAMLWLMNPCSGHWWC